MQMRQDVTGAAQARQLKGRLEEINRSLQSLSASWKETVNDTRVSSPPDLSDVALSIQRLNQTFLRDYFRD